jgi:hypothetical protein
MHASSGTTSKAAGRYISGVRKTGISSCSWRLIFELLLILV